MTAKMQGTLTTNGMSQMLTGKTFQSEATYQNRFVLKAKKFCFIKSNIVLAVTAGFVNVDGQLIPNGQKIRLYPGQVHTIEHDEDGRKIEIQLMANV